MKKSMSKRLLSLVLCAVLCLSMMPSAFSAELEEDHSAEEIPQEELSEPVEQFMAPQAGPARKLTAQTVPASAAEDPVVVTVTEPSVNEEFTEVATTPSGNQVSDEEAAENAAQWARIENEDAHKATPVKISGLYAQSGLGGNDSNISYGGTGISRMAPGAGSEDAGISEASSSTYGVPFTVGLGARFHVAPRLSLGTGLEYSLLTRTFTGTYSTSYTGGIAHYVQYVGIPVNAYYDLIQTRDGLMNIYAWGGGTGEVCVSNNFRLMSAPGTTIKDKAGSLQFSAAAGLGFEFRLSRNLGLYIDPAVRYYFHGNQPKSIRTDKPLMFTVNAGLRFSL